MKDIPLPPQNLEAEVRLIGSIFRDPSGWGGPMTATVKPADFFGPPQHAQAWRLIGRTLKKYPSIDGLALMLEVFEHLVREGPLESDQADTFVTQAMEGTVTGGMAEHYASVVLELSRRRALIGVLDRAMVEAYRGVIDTGSLLTRVAAEMADVGVVGEENESRPIETRPWPDPPSDAVYYGLLGEIVRTIEPQTEADPLAILAQMLVFFGNCVGRQAYFQIEATRHYANEFVVLVGQSAVGRKGTSADWVRHVFAQLDPDWVTGRIRSGLSSGEGLIKVVRDAEYRMEPVLEKGAVRDYQRVLAAEGEDDKRLLAMETEFGAVLRVNERQGNRLSAIIRNAWDHGNLASLTKDQVKATDAHISIVGHITASELIDLLSHVDASNGFGNRFLWLAVRRARLLPLGGNHVDLAIYQTALADVLSACRDIGRVTFTDRARDLWFRSYERLTSPGDGLFGEVTSRGAPHVIRLALIYALSDRTCLINESHLQAGLALWDYSLRCAAHIFGASAHDRAARVLAWLRGEGDWVSLSRLRRELFQDNLPAAELRKDLQSLLERNLIAQRQGPATGGRSPLEFRSVTQPPRVSHSTEVCADAPSYGDRWSANGSRHHESPAF